MTQVSADGQRARREAQLDCRKEAAIAALMTAPTVGQAAEMVGVGEATLRRWMASEPGFQAAYRDARSQALRQAVERVGGMLAKASETLERKMVCARGRGPCCRGGLRADLRLRIHGQGKRDSPTERLPASFVWITLAQAFRLVAGGKDESVRRLRCLRSVCRADSHQARAIGELD